MKFLNFKSTATAVAMLAPLLSTASNESKPKKETKRPNILFCIADDASYHHFSKAGCTWVNTPNFDRVANDGLFFNRCYTPNAKSAPSRAVVLTGRYSWQLREAGNHNCNFPTDIKVFTEALEDVGYSTGYTGKSWSPGYPGMKDGKPRLLTGTPYQEHKLTAPTKGMNACDYASNFQDFLDAKDSDEPWFFWFGCYEPHRAYEYESGIKKGSKNINMIDEVPAFWDDNETVRTDMLDYGFEIENYDLHIGRMLDELEKRGELDNTIVILTSDNGMPFPRCKANNYEYSCHMPMAIMWNDGIKNSGRTISDYVNFIDIAPTVLDAAGVGVNESNTGMLSITGRSLVPIMKNEQSEECKKERKVVYFGRERDDYGRPANQGYPIRAVMKDDVILINNLKPYLYPAGNPEIGYPDVDGSPTKTDILTKHRTGESSKLWNLSMGMRPSEELYDLKTDKYCVVNLANSAEYAAIKEELKTLLHNKLEETKDPRLGANADCFEYYRFNTDDKWNFYEKVTTGEIKEPWKQTGWINPTDYEQHPDNFKCK
ncbi:MAG: sulfatase [Rikenellaceae bacterium]